MSAPEVLAPAPLCVLHSPLGVRGYPACARGLITPHQAGGVPVITSLLGSRPGGGGPLPPENALDTKRRKRYFRVDFKHLSPNRYKFLRTMFLHIYL
jgi:hypothetical protein